jgi:hypothetical protein
MARSDPEKLAQALRANLRRRKSAAQAANPPAPPPPPEPAPEKPRSGEG